MFVRIVKMSFHTKYIPDFLAMFDEKKQSIKDREGCEFLELYQDKNNPEIFFTYSHWRDVDDLEFEVYYIHYNHVHQKGYSIPIPKRKLKVIPFTVPNTKLLMVQLWLQTPETLNIVEKSAPQTIMNVKIKRQLVPLDMEHGEIAVLCKINNVHEEGFPLTKNNKQKI